MATITARRDVKEIFDALGRAFSMPPESVAKLSSAEWIAYRAARTAAMVEHMALEIARQPTAKERAALLVSVARRVNELTGPEAATARRS